VSGVRDEIQGGGLGNDSFLAEHMAKLATNLRDGDLLQVELQAA